MRYKNKNKNSVVIISSIHWEEGWEDQFLVEGLPQLVEQCSYSREGNTEIMIIGTDQAGQGLNAEQR